MQACFPTSAPVVHNAGAEREMTTMRWGVPPWPPAMFQSAATLPCRASTGRCPSRMSLRRRKFFGPVLSILPSEDEADAVRLANGTDFGLMAGVWSKDGSRALRIARRVKAGQVYVNAYGAGGGIELPFGGMKKSGTRARKGFRSPVRVLHPEDDDYQVRLKAAAGNISCYSCYRSHPDFNA